MISLYLIEAVETKIVSKTFIIINAIKGEVDKVLVSYKICGTYYGTHNQVDRQGRKIV